MNADESANPDDGVIGIAEIMRRLPHRFPMLLVDRCEEYVAMTSIVGVKGVTFNEQFFQGHFPGNPVMPGVLVVEAMAQAGAVLMSRSMDIDPTDKTIMFAKLENARFRKPVKPGDQLRMHVRVLKHRGGLFTFEGEAKVEEAVVAESSWTAMLMNAQA